MIAQRVREIEGPSGGFFALLRAGASIPPRIHRPFHRLLSTRTPETEWEALGFQLIVPSAAFDPYLIVVILTIYAGCGNINRNDECGLADIGAGRLNLRENSMVKKVWTITGEVPSCCARRYQLPAANYTAEKAPIYRLAGSSRTIIDLDFGFDFYTRRCRARRATSPPCHTPLASAPSAARRTNAARGRVASARATTNTSLSRTGA